MYGVRAVSLPTSQRLEGYQNYMDSQNWKGSGVTGNLVTRENLEEAKKFCSSRKNCMGIFQSETGDNSKWYFLENANEYITPTGNIEKIFKYTPKYDTKIAPIKTKIEGDKTLLDTLKTLYDSISKSLLNYDKVETEAENTIMDGYIEGEMDKKIEAFR